MKLLFDQNISFRILSKLKINFPEAKQVRELGIENYTDIESWKFAKENNWLIHKRPDGTWEHYCEKCKLIQ